MCYDYCMGKRNISLAIYLVIFVFYLAFVYDNVRLDYLNTVNLLVVAVITFRAIRLVTYDSITRSVRGFLASKDRKDGGLMSVLNELVTCPWCAGLWLAPLMLIIYQGVYILAVVLFIAGIATYIQITANCFGWIAEKNKRKVNKQN